MGVYIMCPACTAGNRPCSGLKCEEVIQALGQNIGRPRDQWGYIPELRYPPTVWQQFLRFFGC